MQGSKYSDEDRIKARELMTAGMSRAAIAKELGIPWSTIHTWLEREKVGENFEKDCEIKKNEFIESCTRIINKASYLIERQLDRATKYEKELDDMLEAMYEKVDWKDKKSIAKYNALAAKIEKLKLQDASRLAVTVGTIYDKRQLETGESTLNVGGSALKEIMDTLKGEKF